MLLTTFLAFVALGQGMDGQAVLDRMAASVAEHKTLTGRAVFYKGGRADEFDFKFMRPFYRCITNINGETWDAGRKSVTYFRLQNMFIETDLPEREKGVLMGAGEMIGFESVLNEGARTLVGRPGSAERMEFHGKGVWKVELKPEEGSNISRTMFVDADSYLPAGYIEIDQQREFQWVTTCVYKEIHLDAPLKPADFEWKVPKDAKPWGRFDFATLLLKPGSAAPDFDLKGPDGERISLSETLKGGKGALINFWFYG